MGSNSKGTLFARFGLKAVAFVGALACSGSSVFGQTFSGPLSNGNLTATVGITGQSNGINVHGRFTLADKYSNPLFGFPGETFYFSPQKTLGAYATIRIDGGENRTQLVNGLLQQTALPGWDLIWGDPGGNTGLVGKGQFLLSPFPVTDGTGKTVSIIASWATTPVAAKAPKLALPSITVELEETLIHDVACIKFIVQNNDNLSHTVGIRFAQQLEFNLDAGIGLPTGQQVCTEADYNGFTLPATWHAYAGYTAQAGLTNGPITMGGVLRPNGTSNDPGKDRTNETVLPTRVVFAPGFSVISDAFPQNDHWDVLLDGDPTFNLCQQPQYVAAATYFPEVSIAPGQRKAYVMYYGRNFATVDFTRPFAAGVQGPTSLKFDPTKPAGQQLVAPGPPLDPDNTTPDTTNPSRFTVTGFIRNLSDVTLTNVQATLSLPVGLALDTTVNGNTLTKSLSNVSTNGEQTVAWTVVPTGITDPSSPSKQTYAVSFSAGPGSQGKSIARSINIPALPVQPTPAGLKMAAFPFTFDDATATTALGLSTLDFDLVRWNSKTGTYEAVQTIEPGKGYWLNLNSDKVLNMVGTHPVSTSQPFQVKLDQGWNQVGNPFLLGVPWGEVSVLNTDASDPDYLKVLSVEQASDINHQWIAPVIYRYDTTQHQYVFDTDFTTILQPMSGYWVKANKPTITLFINPPSGRAAHTTRAATSSVRNSNNWSIRLAAAAGAGTDSNNFIGIASGAQDGLDRLDVEKPPAISGQVSLNIVQANSGRAVSLARDLQAGSGGRKTWNVVVTTPKPNADVTLSWPDITSLPKSYELYITDSSTGQRSMMRSTSSLHVSSGPTASRAFTITAEPRSGVSAFTITGLTVRSTGVSRAVGAVISYNTTQNANVQVRVLKGTGEVVRTLVSRAASTGNNSVTWDHKDNRGTALPAGTYLVEVKGSTTDGQNSRQVAPYLLVR